MANTEDKVILEPRRSQIIRAFKITAAIGDTIRELGEIPSGHIYAGLMGQLTFEAYQSVIRTLEHAKLIRVAPSGLLTWIGPQISKGESQ